MTVKDLMRYIDIYPTKDSQGFSMDELLHLIEVVLGPVFQDQLDTEEVQKQAKKFISLQRAKEKSIILRGDILMILARGMKNEGKPFL